MILKERHKLKSGMTLVEILIFMGLTLTVMAGLFKATSMASMMDHGTEERLAAFFHCKSVLEGLRDADFEVLIAEGSFEAGKGNNGHGNNLSGIDISNPGNSKKDEDAPGFDDEIKNGNVEVGGITVTGIPVHEENDVIFMKKTSGAELTVAQNLKRNKKNSFLCQKFTTFCQYPKTGSLW